MIDQRMLEAEFLRPLTQGWIGKLEVAENSRKEWVEVADECLMFYSRSAAAMWDPQYQRKFWRNVKAPRFRITINKAFEFVAIYGPNLVWDTPYRMVEPKRPYELPQEMFPDEQSWQAAMAMHQQQVVSDRVLASLLSCWLNYTPHEQPGGGLRQHSLLAVVDALVQGRGCLWTRPYTMPSSRRVLTGCFRESPRNLFTDPDFNTLDECKWIARRVVEPTWRAERRFNLPPGSLSNRGTLESAWGYGESRGSEGYNMHRAAGKSNDLIVYYEIFSKMGPGARRTDVPSVIRDHLERVVGDYAYIVVSASVPYPLNMPTEILRRGATEAEVRQAFSWPVPMWADDRWPVDVLDFYPDPNSAWPIPPLAPGLGELKFLNVMVPFLCSRIWSSTRDFWAVAQSYCNDLTKYLEEGADQQVIPMRGDIQDIKKVLNVIQQPETRLDAWKIVDLVSALFDKRVGLSDFMYGHSDTQDRSAETTKSRMQMLGIRPDYMRSQVKEWQSQAAMSEAFVARFFVRGDSLVEKVGPIGAQLWDQLVSSSDVERVLRQFHYTVAASSIRRPDRERDMENAQYVWQNLGPIASEHATATGDTGPLNAMIARLGEAMDFSLEGIEFGPRVPPPPSPEQQQMAEMQMQMEMAKLQADIQKSQSAAQAAQQKIEAGAMQMQMKLQADAAGLEMDAQRHVQEVRQDEEEHDQDMAQRQESHLFELVAEAQKHRQTMAQQREVGRQKVQQAKNQAKARPKAQANGKAKK